MRHKPPSSEQTRGGSLIYDSVNKTSWKMQPIHHLDFFTAPIKWNKTLSEICSPKRQQNDKIKRVYDQAATPHQMIPLLHLSNTNTAISDLYIIFIYTDVPYRWVITGDTDGLKNVTYWVNLNMRKPSLSFKLQQLSLKNLMAALLFTSKDQRRWL